MILHRKRTKFLIGTAVFTTCLFIYVILAGKPSVKPVTKERDAIRARLELEAKQQLDSEVSTLKSDDTRSLRFLQILLGRVDSLDESPAKTSIAKEVTDALARELRVSEQRKFIQKTVSEESLEETIEAMPNTEFSPFFSPRLANPLLFGDVSRKQLSDEMLADPRVAKIVAIAKSENQQEIDMAAKIIAHHLEEMTAGDPIRTDPNLHVDIALPILLAQLDRDNQHFETMVRYSSALEGFALIDDTSLPYGPASETTSTIAASALDMYLHRLDTLNTTNEDGVLSEYHDARVAYSDAVSDLFQRLDEAGYREHIPLLDGRLPNQLSLYELYAIYTETPRPREIAASTPALEYLCNGLNFDWCIIDMAHNR